MITQFKAYLAKTNLAENTITSYVWTVTYYLEHYKEVNKKNVSIPCRPYWKASNKVRILQTKSTYVLSERK